MKFALAPRASKRYAMIICAMSLFLIRGCLICVILFGTGAGFFSWTRHSPLVESTLTQKRGVDRTRSLDKILRQHTYTQAMQHAINTKRNQHKIQCTLWTPSTNYPTWNRMSPQLIGAPLATFTPFPDLPTELRHDSLSCSVRAKIFKKAIVTKK